MKTIYLIACGKRKLTQKAPAASLYVGSLFKKSLAYAKRRAPDVIYILSAKHGLLHLDDEIEPYEMTLNKMPRSDVLAWYDRVAEQLKRCSDLDSDRFVFLTGIRYRAGLTKQMRMFEAPLDRLPLGKQLQFLGESQ